MPRPSLALFVSPHGFGHAARACALIESLAERLEARFTVITTAPRWFFEDSLPGVGFDYVAELSDIGLIQRDSLTVDHEATLAALDGVLPPGADRLRRLRGALDACGADLVVADIAPAGILAAVSRGTPAVLVENFTWDWIYAAYSDADPGYHAAIESSREAVAAASVHVQSRPCCDPAPGAVQVAPIARCPRAAPEAVRARLGIGSTEFLAVVSMGGVAWEFDHFEAIGASRARYVLIGDCRAASLPPNCTVLPPRSGYHHPDLLAAADVVVGKLGYSTVAEALHSRCRVAYVERAGFAEYDVLARHVAAHTPTAVLSETSFRTGNFGPDVDRLLEQPRGPGLAATGADTVADIVARELR